MSALDGQGRFGDIPSSGHVPIVETPNLNGTTETATPLTMNPRTLTSRAAAATWNTMDDLPKSASKPKPSNPVQWPPAGVKPYYSDDAVCIILGDCRDIMPTLPKVDLVLTDPPYGVGLQTAYAANQRGNLTAAHDYPPVHGDDAPFDPAPWLAFPNIIMWGANYYASRLPDQGQWLVWDKRDGIAFNDQADAELAWTRGTGGTVPRIYRHLWNGMLKDSERDQVRVHPTQKPIALMRWCMGFFPDALTILDPFMGSGTTLRAAKDLGRKAIGIEVEERYAEIAARRMSQGVLL